jgi:hypothetical protein
MRKRMTIQLKKIILFYFLPVMRCRSEEVLLIGIFACVVLFISVTLTAVIFATARATTRYLARYFMISEDTIFVIAAVSLFCINFVGFCWRECRKPKKEE